MKATAETTRCGAAVDAGSHDTLLGDHVVQFYETDEFLCDAIANFAAAGLGASDRVILIVTRAHVTAVTRRLDAVGVTCEDAIRTGRLTFLDARETLAGFMNGPDFDKQRCRELLTHVLTKTGEEAADAPGLRVFGEMVNLLWRDGHTAAAIQLEHMSNELSVRFRFDLLCAYAMGNFYRQAHAAAFDQICSSHTQVRAAERYTCASDEERAREAGRLQQRARALESEVEHRKTLEKALRNALAERRRVAEQAEQATRAKSDFLAVMSHELRTPLNAIFGYEDLLSGNMAGPVTPQQKVYLDRIRNSAHHLLQMIDQVLHLARIEAGREELAIEWLELETILMESLQLIEPIAHQKGIEIGLHEPNGSFRVCSDAGKLRQILLHLLSNAVKFTAEGRVSVVVRAENEYVAIAVADTGIGMSTADLNRVFEPFVQVDASHTRPFGGAGLGLSLSRKLARMMGGDITVISTPGQGSTFTLRVPLGSSIPLS